MDISSLSFEPSIKLMAGCQVLLAIYIACLGFGVFISIVLKSIVGLIKRSKD